MPATLSEAFRSPNLDTSSYTRSSLESLKNPNFNVGHELSHNSYLNGDKPPNLNSYGNTSQMSPYNSLPGYGQSGGFQGQNLTYTGNNGSTHESNMFNSYNKASIPQNFSSLGSRENDSASLLSSVSNNHFSDEVDQIRRKYNLKENFSDGSETSENTKETKCDMHIYHILSCSKCRKRLKKLLLDEKEEFRGEGINSREDMLLDLIEDLKDYKSKKRSKPEDQRGGFNQIGSSLLGNLNSLFSNNDMQNVVGYALIGIFLILLFDLFSRFGKRFLPR